MRLYKHEEELVAVSNISIPVSPERITNESSYDPDSTKVVLETEKSMVSIEQDNYPIVQTLKIYCGIKFSKFDDIIRN